jgi:excisionase family DNA binding protein
VAFGKLLTLRECSQLTGHRESTWRAWVLQRKVPFYKVGRSVRVALSDLERDRGGGSGSRRKKSQSTRMS